MPTDRRNGLGRAVIGRTCAGLLLATIALFLGIGQTPASAAPAISEHSVKADPAAVADSWTRQDLLSAEPAPMPVPPKASFDIPAFDAGTSAAMGDFYPPDPTAYPERIQGKVFFNLGPTRYQCSGTLVNSLNGNIVYTAGHCVWDFATQAWMTNFVFIPGYQDGTSPFATYPATTLSTPSGYSKQANLSYDIGMVTVAGNPQADLGGSRQIAFDLDPDLRKYTLYGYPADPNPPYDGERLVGCRSREVLRDATAPQTIGVTPCDMEKGSSGGGWITDGNYLASVTSYSLCDFRPKYCGILWGPYFTKAAKALYKSGVAGGSVTPTLIVKFSPPKVVRKRRVLFRFSGTGSTPLRFRCRIDGKPFRNCDARTTIGNLAPGRHVLRVRSIDQTGHESDKTIKKTFRVVIKNR